MVESVNLTGIVGALESLEKTMGSLVTELKTAMKVFNDFSKQVGKSAKEVNNAMESTATQVKESMEKIDNSAKESAVNVMNAFSTMRSGFKSLRISMPAPKIDLEGNEEEIFADLRNSFKDTTEIMANRIRELNANFEGLKIGDNFKDDTEKLTNFSVTLKNTSSEVNSYSSFVKKMSFELNDLAKNLGLDSDYLKKLKNDFRGMVVQAETFQQEIKGTSVSLSNLTQEMKNLEANKNWVKSLGINFKDLRTVVEATGTSFDEISKKGLAEFKRNLAKIVPEMDTFKTKSKVAMETVTASATEMKGLFKWLSGSKVGHDLAAQFKISTDSVRKTDTVIEKLITSLRGIPGYGKAASKSLEGMFGKVESSTGSLFAGISGGMGGGEDLLGIGGILKSVGTLGSVGAMLGSVFQTATAEIPFLGTVVGLFRTLFDVGSFGIGVFKSLSSVFGSVFGILSSKGTGAIGGIIGAFKDLTLTLTGVSFAFTALQTYFSTQDIMRMVIDFTKQSIEMFGEFSNAMMAVSAVTEATTGEFELLRKEAMNLGAELGRFTPEEAAQGMKILGQAGFSVNEILNATGQSLALAEIGFYDLERTTEIMANTLRAFQIDATNSTKVVNILAKAITSSNQTLEQLGVGLQYVAPVASALRIELEETVATLGILADGGIKASIAGTTMRNIYLRLVAPIGRAEERIKALGEKVEDLDFNLEESDSTLGQLGISLVDSEGKFLGIQHAVELFTQKMAGWSDEAKAMTLKMIFGERSFAGFQLLMNSLSADVTKGAKNFAEYRKEIDAVAGTEFAKELQDKVESGMGMVTKIVESAWETVKIETGSALEGMIVAFKDFFAGADRESKGFFSKIINTIKPTFQEFGNSVAKIIERPEFETLLTSLLNMVNTFMGSIGKLVTNIVGAGVEGANFLNVISGVMKMFFSFVDFFNSTFGKTIFSVMNIFAGLVNQIAQSFTELFKSKSSQGFADMMTEIGKLVSDTFTPIVASMKAVFDTISKGDLVGLIEPLLKLMIKVFEIIGKVVVAFMPILGVIIEIVKIGSQLLIPVLDVVVDILDLISKLFVSTFGDLGKMFKNLDITDMVESLSKALGSLFSGKNIGSITRVLTKVVDIVFILADAFMEVFSDDTFITILVLSLKDMLGMINEVLDSIIASKDLIPGFIASLSLFVVTLAKLLIASGAGLLEALLDPKTIAMMSVFLLELTVIMEAIILLLPGIVELFKLLLPLLIITIGAIVGILSALMLFSVALLAVTGAIAGVINWILDLGMVVLFAITGVSEWSDVLDHLGEAWNIVGRIIGGVLFALTGAVMDLAFVIGGILWVFGALWDGIVWLFTAGKVTGSGRDFAENFIRGVYDVFEPFLKWIVDTLIFFDKPENDAMAKQSGVDFITFFTDGISSALAYLYDTIVNSVMYIYDIFVNVFTSIFTTIYGVALTVFSGIYQFIMDIINGIVSMVSLITSVSSKITGAVGLPSINATTLATGTGAGASNNTINSNDSYNISMNLDKIPTSEADMQKFMEMLGKQINDQKKTGRYGSSKV